MPQHLGESGQHYCQHGLRRGQKTKLEKLISKTPGIEQEWIANMEPTLCASVKGFVGRDNLLKLIEEQTSKLLVF